MMAISKICWLAVFERTILTLWIGGMWITGYLVAPTLFSSLDDRQLAGMLAGQIFQNMNYVGLVAGGFLLMSVFVNSRNGRLREWRVWTLVVMLVILALAAFMLQPMMQELKTQGIVEGSEQATQFGRLHGLSSILYLLNSLLGLLLVADGTRRKNVSGGVNPGI